MQQQESAASLTLRLKSMVEGKDQLVIAQFSLLRLGQWHCSPSFEANRNGARTRQKELNIYVSTVDKYVGARQ